jgi:hypothetical protein
MPKTTQGQGEKMKRRAVRKSYVATDAEIEEWADRHAVRISSKQDLRAAFEDAQTFYLTKAKDNV